MPRHVQTDRNRDGGQGRTWRRANPTRSWTKYGESVARLNTLRHSVLRWLHAYLGACQRVNPYGALLKCLALQIPVQSRSIPLSCVGVYYKC